jgi:hypothetical protein
MREVFDMASAEDLARSKVQRTPLPFAEATRLYYEGKDTEDDWRQCPKAQSTNAPGTYLISVYRPSADEAEKIVLEDTSEDELEFGSVDSASDGAGECVVSASDMLPGYQVADHTNLQQEDVLSVQDVDTRTSSAEKDKVKVDDDNEETDEDGATFFHELNEICKTLRDQDSPLSANEFARCKALLAAYAGKSRSGYSSDNQTVAIVVGSMQIGLARRDLDHFRGSVHGKGMLVYRDEHGIARNPWQMLVSSNCESDSDRRSPCYADSCPPFRQERRLRPNRSQCWIQQRRRASRGRQHGVWDRASLQRMASCHGGGGYGVSQSLPPLKF